MEESLEEKTWCVDIEDRIRAIEKQIMEINKKIKNLDYWQIKLCAKHGIE